MRIVMPMLYYLFILSNLIGFVTNQLHYLYYLLFHFFEEKRTMFQNVTNLHFTLIDLLNTIGQVDVTEYKLNSVFSLRY